MRNLRFLKNVCLTPAVFLVTISRLVCFNRKRSMSEVVTIGSG